MAQNYIGYIEGIGNAACQKYADQISEDPNKYGKFNGKPVTLWTDEVRHQKVNEISCAIRAVSIALIITVAVAAVAFSLLVGAFHLIGIIALASTAIPIGIAAYSYAKQRRMKNEFTEQAIREAQDFLKFGPVDTWRAPWFRDSLSSNSGSFDHANRAKAIASRSVWRQVRMIEFNMAKAQPNFIQIVQKMYQGQLKDPACSAFLKKLNGHDPECQKLNKSIKQEMAKFA